MGLQELYNEMSEEQKAGLGKSSSKINTAGTHLVTIESMKVIDDKRVRVDFKSESGQTIDYTGFLTASDPSKVEATVNRVMSQLAAMCTAAGTNIKSVLAKSVAGSETYSTGTVTTEEYPAIKGKKLYITTTTQIEADDKDANKCWVKQEIDVFKFFDTKKRNGLEISSDAEVGTTMESADAEAKKTFKIHYKHTANKACQAKLAELQGGQYAPTTTSAQAPVADDEI